MSNDAAEPKPATRFPFDSVYKALCCHRRTVRDMLQGYLVRPHGPLRRELVAALEFDTLTSLRLSGRRRGTWGTTTSATRSRDG